VEKVLTGEIPCQSLAASTAWTTDFHGEAGRALRRQSADSPAASNLLTDGILRARYPDSSYDEETLIEPGRCYPLTIKPTRRRTCIKKGASGITVGRLGSNFPAST